MRWLIAICVVVVALGAAGCGGSDESSGDTQATLTETVASDETTTDEGTTEDDSTMDDTDLSALTSEDCLALSAAIVAVNQAFAGTASDIDSSEFEKYADSVPEDIQADLQTIADVGTAAAAAYAKLDVAPGETPNAEQLAEYGAAMDAIDTEEYSAATERVGAFTEEACSGG
jgi:hypothetical protein